MAREYRGPHRTFLQSHLISFPFLHRSDIIHEEKTATCLLLFVKIYDITLEHETFVYSDKRLGESRTLLFFSLSEFELRGRGSWRTD